MQALPTYDDVLTAQSRLRGIIRPTPLLQVPRLNQKAEANLWLKAENMQHVGAFKARGAYNSVAQLRPDQLAKGLITYSSGNHAQALAWAAAHFKAKARIFMPTTAPEVKVAGVKRLGAEVISVGTTSLERQAAAQEESRKTGGTIVEPFDHPHTIAGQGTASLELKQEVSAAGQSLDQLFVPVGGGGLIAGACLAFNNTDTQIISVEPVGCDSLKQSMAAGEIIAVEPGASIADGLKPTKIGQMNFAICQSRVSLNLTVTDPEIAEAMTQLLMWGKSLVEPSGAAALAAALRYARKGCQVGVILSGGNVSQESLEMLLANHRV